MLEYDSAIKRVLASLNENDLITVNSLAIEGIDSSEVMQVEQVVTGENVVEVRLEGQGREPHDQYRLIANGDGPTLYRQLCDCGKTEFEAVVRTVTLAGENGELNDGD